MSKIYPRGKGFYIYIVKAMMEQLDGYNTFEDVALDLVQNNFGHVIVKVANGYYPYNDDVDMKEFVKVMKDHGLQVFGFQYIYQPKLKSLLTRTAAAGAQQFIELDLHGLVANAERQWHYGVLAGTKSSIAKNATFIASEYRRLLPGAMLALSGYRHPLTQQPKYPCREFMNFFDVNMPQVYWMGKHNAVEQLYEAWRQHNIYAPGKIFTPTGFAFSEGGYAPYSREIEDFWAATQKMGIVANFYELRNSKLKQTQDFHIIYDVVAALEEDGETPEPDEQAIRNQAFDDVIDAVNDMKV